MARRFVTAQLSAADTDVVEDAQLVVTELVTNAVLHGAGPLVLRVDSDEERVRIEVQDAVRVVPMLPLTNLDAMTGRGLSLVASLSESWGVSPVPGGKVVWAELSTGPSRPDSTTVAVPDVDIDALLSGWKDDDPDAEPLYTVRLGAVPTNLLLDAKSHIDNVVREFMLLETQDAGQEPAAARAPTRLVDAVVRSFAGARNAIKRQALEAAATGEPVTDLVLTQPASAAAAGEEYLAALDEADRYARAARLLTLEAPPLHRVFRRWYVQSLVDQIRAQAVGGPAPIPLSFLQVLSQEVADLASLRESWDRLQLLQKVTAELTDAGSVDEIARTVVRNAMESMGAMSGRVYLLSEDGSVLRSLADGGGTDDWVNRYHEIPINADLPGAEVLRSGEALLLRSSAEITARYPALEGVYGSNRSLHVSPLTIRDHRLGVLTLTFPASGSIDETTQVSFVRALADALAQALERSLALARAAAASERLSFLADASVALSGSIDYEETVEAVGTLLVPRLADWCVVQVLRGNELVTVGLHHFDPEMLARVSVMRGRFPTRMDVPSGAPHVLRTGASELYPEIPFHLIEQSAVNAEHLEVIRELGMRSALVVPLTGRQGTFGAVTLIYAESGRHYDDRDVPFAEEVARRAALALDTADTFREQSGRLADVTRVAVAAQEAILAAPPARVGAVALSARYVSAAAAALVGGDLYEVVARPGMVRLLIGDVRGKGLTAVRTATVVLGEFRAAAADVDDLELVAQQIDRRLRPYLGDEDFVTALLAEIHDDGRYAIAACGHPSALIAADGRISSVDHEATLPLGLGADPTLSTGMLKPGERLLLYTDGIVEARNSAREFVDLMSVMSPLAAGDLDTVLDEVLRSLHEAVGPELGDDLALLVAEYQGP